MGTPQSEAPAPVRQPTLPPSRSPWPSTGRGCSRIFQYENPTTTELLTSFLPRFLPGDTPQDRAQVLIVVTTPPVTRSPVQPRSLDFVQPGVGLLPSLHLDGVSVLHRTRPPGCRHERKNFYFYRSSVTRGHGVHTGPT